MVQRNGWEKTDWKYNNPVNKWMVDAEDPRYVEYFGGLIKELGKRYDGHPALESVDLSIVGAWGEGRRVKSAYSKDKGGTGKFIH